MAIKKHSITEHGKYSKYETIYMSKRPKRQSKRKKKWWAELNIMHITIFKYKRQEGCREIVQRDSEVPTQKRENQNILVSANSTQMQEGK